jgi:hypothetical protein
MFTLKRWQNREGRAGYSPVCRNEWKSGICRKPPVKCFDCRYQAYEKARVADVAYPARRSGPKGQDGCRYKADSRFQREGSSVNRGNLGVACCRRRRDIIQIQHPSEICDLRSENRLAELKPVVILTD